MKRRIITLLMVVGMTAPLLAQRDNHNFEVAKNMEIFNSLYKELDRLYVDTLNADTLITTAIDEMLATLDPFTEYYPEKDEKELIRMTKGKYAGIGAAIRYSKREDRVRIGDPFEGSPAQKAGLRAGDVIMSVNGKDVKGLKQDKVSEMLIGEPSTSVEVEVKREGQKKNLNFKLIRQLIQLPHVPYEGMIEGTSVGYLYLEDFSEGAAKEMKRAVVDLKAKGATSLIIDLRNNGGGSLVEAVDIVNFFVPKNKPIVEMRGKVKSVNYKYSTHDEPIDLTIPLAILVDGGTASAAEIVSGALQDLDRAVVIGSRTYGKGIVQQVRELPYNTKIKLTTSKYYIPSGRCIQAFDYRHTDEYGNGTRVPDSLTHAFKTEGGREVRDGGGIKPDISTKADSVPANNIVYYIAVSDLPLDFAAQYAAKHKTIAPAGQFSITDEDYDDFVKMVEASDFTYDRRSEGLLKRLKLYTQAEGYYDGAQDEFAALEKKLQHNLDNDLRHFKKDITEWINNEIVRLYYYQKGSIQQQIGSDKNVKKAIEILNDGSLYKKILTVGNK